MSKKRPFQLKVESRKIASFYTLHIFFYFKLFYLLLMQDSHNYYFS